MHYTHTTKLFKRPIFEQSRLRLLANQIRRDVIMMTAEAHSGHPAGALGLAEVFAVLYGFVARHQPKNPEWKNRDRIVLSNGHVCAGLYSVLARTGYFSREKLMTFRQINSPLQGHPHFGSVAGIENSSGPLGLGLSQAIGITQALKLQNIPAHTFCILSDAEHQEGQTWEAYAYAGARKLGGLTSIIDRNNIQIGGYTSEVLDLEPFEQKIAAFGWNTIVVDGHDIAQLANCLQTARAQSDKPTAIVCHTIA